MSEFSKVEIQFGQSDQVIPPDMRYPDSNSHQGHDPRGEVYGPGRKEYEQARLTTSALMLGEKTVKIVASTAKQSKPE